MIAKEYATDSLPQVSVDLSFDVSCGRWRHSQQTARARSCGYRIGLRGSSTLVSHLHDRFLRDDVPEMRYRASVVPHRSCEVPKTYQNAYHGQADFTECLSSVQPARRTFAGYTLFLLKDPPKCMLGPCRRISLPCRHSSVAILQGCPAEGNHRNKLSNRAPLQEPPGPLRRRPPWPTGAKRCAKCRAKANKLSTMYIAWHLRRPVVR